MITIAVSVFPWIKNYYYRIANKYFFSSLYDVQELIASLSEKLGSTLQINNIYNYIAKTLTDSFHTRSLIFLGYDEATDHYEIKYRVGIGPLKPKSFIGNPDIDQLFSRKGIALVLDELDPKEKARNKKILKLLKDWGAVVAVPLLIKSKIIGLLLLSKKESGDVYNDIDLRVLGIISAQAAMALENAELYHETLGFSQRLTREVEKATYDLRIANAELKKLDVAKSEFVSIASHQLRAPLTAIRGFTSMIRDGDYGKVNPKQEKPLWMVFESAERLIHLMEELLDISRIESGKMEFKFEPVQLSDMVQSVCTEAGFTAKKKDVTLTFDPPAEPLPLVRVDLPKIRQVAQNLIDNSVKYTPEGGWVKVHLQRQGDKIIFCVSDNGMGISAEDLPRLFAKFSRGTDMSVIHPEGCGLGLYVARQMVEAHGGRIWAESEGVGKGSRFCFEVGV